MKQYFQQIIDVIAPWLLSHGIRIMIILISAYVFHAIIKRIVMKMIALAVLREKDAADESKKREKIRLMVFC